MRLGPSDVARDHCDLIAGAAETISRPVPKGMKHRARRLARHPRPLVGHRLMGPKRGLSSPARRLLRPRSSVSLRDSLAGNVGTTNTLYAYTNGLHPTRIMS